MKNINTAIRLIAVRLGLPGGGALSEGLVSGREDHPRTGSRLARWATVQALVIASVAGPVMAQDDDTITVSSTFSPYGLYEPIGADLAEVYTNGQDHVWTLTLYGTTQSHSTVTYFGGSFKTTIHATSFDFEFFGPDAATLNGIVSEHIAGGEVTIELYNSYPWNQAFLWVEASGPEVFFWTGHDTFGSDTLFPADADGYPVLGPEPFSIEPEYSWLGDYRDGNGGAIEGWGNLVTFEVMPSLPRLTITSSNNAVIVSWPSPSTGFSLQQNHLLNATNWVTPTETVTDTGTIKFITVDPPMGSRFYRLFKP